MKWIGPTPVTIEGGWGYSFKKSAPADLRPFLRRIDFGLHGLLWCVIRDRCLVAGGREIPLHDAFLTTPGHVVGIRDIEAAQHFPWSHEWRESMHARIQERLAIQ